MDENDLVSYRGAIKMTSLGERTIRRLVAAGDFPQPVRLTPRRLAFVRGEVAAWIAERVADARDQAASAGASNPRA